MTTLRVLHVATHGHNIGDGALVAGLQETLAADLAADLGVRVEYTPLDVLECKVRGQRDMLAGIDAVALDERYDLVLVGGGGMIEGGKGNYLSGINFNFRLELLERTTVPWAFYALGFNHFRRSFFYHRRRLARLLEIAERRGLPVSVRNDGSRARLLGLLAGGPSVERVCSIPDPGVYVPVRPGRHPELAAGRLNVLVQLAGDRPRARFGLFGGGVVARLARFLAELVERRGVHLVLAPHLLADLPVYAALVAALPKRVVRASCTLGPVLVGAAKAPDFFALYRAADLVLGMRGHSVICAVGTGTPVVGLATHDKVGGFLEEVGLGDWTVDLERDRRLATLAGRVDGILADLPAARARVAALLPGLRESTRRFHGQVADLVRGRWRR